MCNDDDHSEASLLERFARGGRRSKDQQRARGVYRTPRPLIRYVVRSVDVLLRSKLGFAAGLADPEVRLLDPAAGAMDFIRVALHEAAAMQPLAPASLGRFVGIELVEEEHARGFAALCRLSRAAGCSAHPAVALLGDALEPLPGLAEKPFNVIIGNPPWRGRSSNRGAWITDLLHGYTLPDGRTDEGYFRGDGRPLGERNPKWLYDDYVKFLRLAQWQIDRNGEGVAGLVLNHNLLDAPTFRGLRRSLLRTFQEIYVLDLHGSSWRREPDREGLPDDNVFPEVAQGAAVVLLVRKPGLRQLVARADLRGRRAEKLALLGRAHVGTMEWAEVEPAPPAYLFVKGDRALAREYERGVLLTEIFPVHGVGIVTGRDALATALDRTTLERRLAELRQLPSGLPPGDRSARAVEALRADSVWRRKLVRFLARPFDVRSMLYADYFLARPRRRVMDPMRDESNLGLVVPRQCKEEPGALVTRWMIGHKAVSSHDVATLFPLYLGAGEARRPNLAPDFGQRLGELFGSRPQPETILAYVYAVLYHQPWRRRYRELLQRDFPRIPMPSEPELFLRLAAAGRDLTELHLLEHPRLHPGGSLPGLGEIDPEIWAYRIGGYRVLRQWLWARRSRNLSGADAKELRQIAEALRRTREVQDAMGGDGLPGF